MDIKRVLFLRLPPYFGYTRHHPHDVTLPFSTAYAASAIKETGREVMVVDVWANNWELEQVLRHISNFQPEVIFFDSHTSVVPVLQEVNHAIKKQFPVKTVIFGAVSTFFPEVIFNGSSLFDVGIVGECEDTVVELLDALDKNRSLEDVAGLVYWQTDNSQIITTAERPLCKNLDNLPFIDYTFFNLKHYRKYSFPIPLYKPVKWGHILSTRGCPYTCSFCSHDHRQTYGKTFRTSSPKRVADEFERLVLNHNVNAISIEDDCFTLDNDYVISLCDELEKRNLDVKWVAQTRVDLVNRKLMKRIKRAGCVGLSFGVESGNDRVLNILQKGITRSQSEQVFRDATDEGLMLRLLFMIGNPSETVEEVKETIDLAIKAKAITIQVHFCTPYPGTSFFRPQEGDMSQLNGYSSYNNILRNMSYIPDEQLLELRNYFYHKYYLSWRYFKLFFQQRFRYVFGQAVNDAPFILRSFMYVVRTNQSTVREVASKVSN